LSQRPGHLGAGRTRRRIPSSSPPAQRFIKAEQAERNEEITRKRLDLPWVPVEKQYEFDTEDGKRPSPTSSTGAPSCSPTTSCSAPATPGLAAGLDGSLVHLNHRDVTLLCFSRAPIGRLSAYKRRMGWQFRYVSTYHTDFALSDRL
jgi:predicted dithiol-disulfide oxidoreductase (DUF899 family)